MDWCNHSSLLEVTPPTAEPVSVKLAKQHLRLGGDEEAADDHESLNLPAYISAARRHAELVTGLILTDAIYETRMPSFCYRMLLNAAPVAEVLGITYLDEDGVEQTVDPAVYVLDAHPWGPRVRLAHGQTWPITRGADGDEIAIRFRSPFGSTEDSPARLAIPDDLKVAILLMTAHWYENREEVVIGSTATNVPLAAMHILQLNRRSMGV